MTEFVGRGVPLDVDLLTEAAHGDGERLSADRLASRADCDESLFSPGRPSLETHRRPVVLPGPQSLGCCAVNGDDPRCVGRSFDRAPSARPVHLAGDLKFALVEVDILPSERSGRTRNNRVADVLPDPETALARQPLLAA